MSTKCSLSYGENFHLYNECLDDDNVYLRLTKPAFQVDCDNLTVTIPIHIWETIRHHGTPDLSLCDLSDDDILAKVTKEVDERIKEHQNAEGNKNEQAILNILGCLVFGGAEEPRITQIESGISYYKAERSRQQEIKSKIEALKKKD